MIEGQEQAIRKEDGDRSARETSDDSLLVKPSHKTQRTGSASVTMATEATKNTPTHSAFQAVKKVMGVIREQKMSLGPSSSRELHNASIASQLCEFDDEML